MAGQVHRDPAAGPASIRHYAHGRPHGPRRAHSVQHEEQVAAFAALFHVHVHRLRQPVGRPQLIAGFEVSINCRFWVSTEGDFRFFGYVLGFESEWGYFVLSELEAVRGPLNLPIERDLYFEPKRFSELQADLG